jgi:hypothetical protein
LPERIAAASSFEAAAFLHFLHIGEQNSFHSEAIL